MLVHFIMFFTLVICWIKNVTFTFYIIVIGPSCKLDMRDCSCLMDLILQVSWTLASLVKKKNCLDGGSVTVIELE